MFAIHCVDCERRYLVGTRSIESFHNTTEGPMATVKCPAGHLVVHHFHQAHRHLAAV